GLLPGAELGGAVDLPGAGPEEDERGDTGGGRDEHGDLPHGVPGTDVHEGDVDDVAAVAVLVRLLGEVDGDRHVDAGAGRDHRQPAGHEPDDGAERGAPPAGG